ncbi:transcription factor S [Nanoarchaeota archaeon]
MEFCPKCGAVLVQKVKHSGCPRCSHTSKGKLNIKSSEKINAKKEIPVLKEGQNEIHPVVLERCKKCGNDKAYFWTVQTRASDESETKFFKCVKCGTTKRDYR